MYFGEHQSFRKATFRINKKKLRAQIDTFHFENLILILERLDVYWGDVMFLDTSFPTLLN